MLWYKTLVAILCLLSSISRRLTPRRAVRFLSFHQFRCRDEAIELRNDLALSPLVPRPSNLRHQFRLLNVAESDLDCVHACLHCDDEDLSFVALATALRLFLSCFTTDRSSVIESLGAPGSSPLGTWEAKPVLPTNLPCQCRLLRIGSKVRTFTRQPAKRSKSAARVNFRSRPGELASSVYAAPGIRSSTSSKTPKSRLNAVQSSCVTPESCSTASVPSRRPFGPVLALSGSQLGLQLRAALGVFLEVNAKSTLLGRANKLDIDNVQSVRGCHTLRRRPDFVQLDRHRSQRPSGQTWLAGNPSLHPTIKITLTEPDSRAAHMQL